jgi:hypothetical protein
LFIQRLAPGLIPYSDGHSVNIDYCGESQGCLIVPQNCMSGDKCDYALSWQVLDENSVKFHIVARAHGFVGVGFSKDEKRVNIKPNRTNKFTRFFQGDDQIILCTKDANGYVYVRNMFVGVQTPQYISRERPAYGLRDTDGHSNGSHIICKFVRTLSPQSDTLGDDGSKGDGVDQNKLVNLKEPHYMYPIYADQDLTTPQGSVFVDLNVE